ncbi:MAG TPA: MinD/ParA family protein, partial [Coleofasciculaceae cyanobacterium]
PSYDFDALKEEAQKTYNVPVAGILPHSEEMMRLASSGVFCLQYPTHPLSKVIDGIAKQIMD